MRKPEVWLLLAVLVCAAATAIWLVQPDCTAPAARDLEVYWARHYWRCAFDALSTTCGCGLLSYDLRDAYTPQGRWCLTAAGWVGGALFLAAAFQTLRRVVPAARDIRFTAIFGAFVALSVLSIGTVLLAQLGEEQRDWHGAVWDGLAAISSSGALRPRGSNWVTGACAAIGLAAALGWPTWLLIVPAYRRLLPTGAILKWIGGYVLFLLLMAALVTVNETPRGWRTRSPEAGPLLSQSPITQRAGRALLQTAAAGGAGVATESFAERDLSDASKGLFGLVALLGGLAGSPAGSIHVTTLLAVIFLRRRRAAGTDAEVENAPPASPPDAANPRQVHVAALGVLFWMSAATAVFALGMLVLETMAASAFQRPPSLADAWLDACAAVGGAAVSSGLIATLTDQNLVGGMYQTTDLYQYGMVWIMLAMLAGRVLPLRLWRRSVDFTS